MWHKDSSVANDQRQLDQGAYWIDDNQIQDIIVDGHTIDANDYNEASQM